VEARLRQALARAEEVSAALSDPAVAKDSDRLTALGREHARLTPIVRSAERLLRLKNELQQARGLAGEADPEMAALVQADIDRLPAEIAALEHELGELLVPRDPLEDRDAIVEIRAGTGGDEAALFAADLLRMYTRFAERHGLRVEPLAISDGTLGGVKEAVIAIRGSDAYGLFRQNLGRCKRQHCRPVLAQDRSEKSRELLLEGGGYV